MAYYSYSCRRRQTAAFPQPDDAVWDGLPEMTLADTVTGVPSAQTTRVKLFHDGRALYLGFWADDDGVLSDYTRRDEPIYRQDVLEVFFCDTEDPARYKELQVSPHNVQYDADIIYYGPGNVDIDVAWDFPGWTSWTHYDAEAARLTSVWRLPFDGFTAIPSPGDVWRVNVTRCDHSAYGISLDAWSPTGVPDYHVPDRFGWLEFKND